jgi:uncharacterized membrane protein YdjX (TVP38/TMEM64 family)
LSRPVALEIETSPNATDEAVELKPPANYGVAPLAVIIIFSCIATVGYRYTSRTQLYNGLQWMSGNLALGRVSFVLLYIMCMALMLPGSVLALLAGMFIPSSVLEVLSRTGGACTCT